MAGRSPLTVPIRPRYLLAVIGILWLALGTAAPGAADAETPGIRTAEAALLHLRPPKPPAGRSVARVFSAAALGEWERAYTLARESTEPVFPKVVSWVRFATPGERVTFDEVAAFIDQNPDWPEMETLRANAEAALDGSVSLRRVIDWFGRHPPLTPEGAMALADAYLATGEQARARRTARRAWVEMNFSAAVERRFYRRFRRMLTADDHVMRLDRLLWDGRTWEARRMLDRVNAEERIVAVARIRLRRFRGGVDWAIRRIPDHRLDDVGFVYERLRWRRRKGRDDDAIALLDGLPRTLPRPERWWRERGTLARRALRRGEITRAYRLAAGHHQTGGASHADAEWLAGWIALRFLNDAKTAAGHFERVWSNVSYPISRARGAYWAGRAAEAEGARDKAREWFRKAGRHFTTFYGQLALGKLGSVSDRPLPETPNVEAETARAYLKRDVVRAAKLIAASEDRTHFQAFIRHLVVNAGSPAEYALAAEIAIRSGRPDVALKAAKQALREDTTHLIRAGWPTGPLPRDLRGLEPSLLLALMRQESAFDPEAVSWAGARGLMQLMPATARRVARSLKMPFSRQRLLNDHHYNLAIGTAYLSDVISDFGGSYVLGLAAYNAGPSRARRWLRRHGDFRAGETDAVDWIEMIPFDQTRNYVQRVIENLQVYRAILGSGRASDTALTDAIL